MTKSVSAVTARENFGEILESVCVRSDEIIIERAGEPLGVLIPMAAYRSLERQRAGARAQMERLWADAPPTVDGAAAERDISAETETVRHGPALT